MEENKKIDEEINREPLKDNMEDASADSKSVTDNEDAQETPKIDLSSFNTEKRKRETEEKIKIVKRTNRILKCIYAAIFAVVVIVCIILITRM